MAGHHGPRGDINTTGLVRLLVSLFFLPQLCFLCIQLLFALNTRICVYVYLCVCLCVHTRACECACTTCVPNACGSQKTSDRELPCGCQKPNPGPLREQQMCGSLSCLSSSWVECERTSMSSQHKTPQGQVLCTRFIFPRGTKGRE